VDIVSSLSTAITYAQRLREISKNAENAEFKNVLADLLNQLGDVKLELAGFKEKLANLEEENQLLKKRAVSPDEKPSGRKWGCYTFEGDDGLFCTGCWDSKRLKASTSRVNSKYRICSVCQAPIGVG
jgi:hypothetical protein